MGYEHIRLSLLPGGYVLLFIPAVLSEFSDGCRWALSRGKGTNLAVTKDLGVELAMWADVRIRIHSTITYYYTPESLVVLEEPLFRLCEWSDN